MNFAHVVRLTWKEYRAARAFWVSLIVLVVLVQALILATWSDRAWAVSMLYSLALAAPAFFAIGGAGSAFALEREEGTYDFLRAAPIHPREVLASKLGLTSIATLAMFGVLWLLTMALASGRLPEPDQLRRMLGLWLLAAVEAAAWGTLFSLRSARPLAAIVLAMLTATSVVHLLAWSTNAYTPGDLNLESYSAALPWRAVVVLIVLVVDVYLGLRWLEERQSLVALPRATGRSAKSTTFEAGKSKRQSATRLAAADRGGMLGRLFWQQWRQSGWLMLTLSLIYIALVVTAYKSIVPVPGMVLLVMAPLFGCFVFRADQEQRRHRYFVEHNIPPRYVWFSRQLPWLMFIIALSLVACLAWVGLETLGKLWIVLWNATNSPWYEQRLALPEALNVPPVGLALAVMAVAYAAGQWASMLIRSGLLAGLCGLVLAAVLGCWVLLMYEWQVGWIWSIVPIPLVLLWATWYRAPDWALENTSWPARIRAAAAVGVPATMLLVAVPWYRVHEKSRVDPGFVPAQYLARLTPAAKATGDLYLRANELSLPAEHYVVPRTLQTPSNRMLTAGHLEWLKLNAEALAVVLEASRHKECAFQDPRTMDDFIWLHGDSHFVSLVLASARELAQDGKLDEALDRCFTGLTVISQLSDPTLAHGKLWQLHEVEGVFAELSQWADAKGQTSERVLGAIARLQAIDSTLLRSDEALEANYILAARYVRGDVAAQRALFDENRSPRDHSDRRKKRNVGNERTSPSILWPKFAPWETYRGQRWLNQLTQGELAGLREMRNVLAKGGGVDYLLPPTPFWEASNQLNSFMLGWDEPWPRPRPDWVNAISPNLDPLVRLGTYQARLQAAFEARRRGTILLLAIEAFRIDHAKLPATLDELVGNYLDHLPNDPYSGVLFEYYPEGLPEPSTPLERAQLEYVQRMAIPLAPGWPCVWCTGPTLQKSEWRAYDLWADDPNRPDRWTHYTLRKSTPDWSQIPMYLAWAHGNWFPIPRRTE